MSEPLTDLPLEEGEDDDTHREPLGVPESGDETATATEPPEDADETDEAAQTGTDDDTAQAEPEPELEPEPEPEPSFGMDEREFEKAAKTLERAVTAYRTKVEAFIETTGQPLVPNKVDLDYLPGYVFHPDARPLEEEQAQFARILLGDPLEPPFPQAPDTHTCDTCQGWGRVKTGSKVSGQQLVNCERCAGHGWIGSRTYDSITPALSIVGDDTNAPVLTEEEEAGLDVWGTPRNHPDWGKSPQYRSPNWATELEAYKSGEPAPIS